jgi:hypothetical protein
VDLPCQPVQSLTSATLPIPSSLDTFQVSPFFLFDPNRLDLSLIPLAMMARSSKINIVTTSSFLLRRELGVVGRESPRLDAVDGERFILRGEVRAPVDGEWLSELLRFGKLNDEVEEVEKEEERHVVGVTRSQGEEAEDAPDTVDEMLPRDAWVRRADVGSLPGWSRMTWPCPISLRPGTASWKPSGSPCSLDSRLRSCSRSSSRALVACRVRMTDSVVLRRASISV